MLFGFIAKENGGYNDGDPPLPIPNREVKPISADDTAIPSGKVGSRQLIETFSQKCLEVFFLFWCLHRSKSSPYVLRMFSIESLEVLYFYISGILFCKSFSSLFRFFKFDLWELLHYGPILSPSASFTEHFK